jgi:hypothetical protein
MAGRLRCQPRDRPGTLFVTARVAPRGIGKVKGKLGKNQ